MERNDLAKLALAGTCAPAALIAAARLLHLEYIQGVVTLQATTPVVFLPIYVALGFAIVRRKYAIGGIALVLVALQLWWLWPEIVPPNSPTLSQPRSVAIYDQNLLGGKNPSLARIGQQIRDEDPDLVFLQEAVPEALEVLERDGTFDSFAWNHVAYGIAIYSRFPLEVSSQQPDERSRSNRVVAEINGTDVVLYAVHPPAPLVVSDRQWLEAQSVLKNALHSESGTVIAAGDFNASLSHRTFREIVSNGYREAHSEVGRGYARTWPVDDTFGPIPPSINGLLRLDHVVMRGKAKAVSAKEVPGNGSDHRGIVVELEIGR